MQVNQSCCLRQAMDCRSVTQINQQFITAAAVCQQKLYTYSANTQLTCSEQLYEQQSNGQVFPFSYPPLFGWRYRDRHHLWFGKVCWLILLMDLLLRHCPYNAGACLVFPVLESLSEETVRNSETSHISQREWSIQCTTNIRGPRPAID